MVEEEEEVVAAAAQLLARFNVRSSSLIRNHLVAPLVFQQSPNS